MENQQATLESNPDDPTKMTIQLLSLTSPSHIMLPDSILPPQKIPFGRPMRSLFNFAPTYHPLNHGSYGTFPRYVLESKIQKLREYESRPSVYHTFVYPSQLVHSRSLIAPLLGAHLDEVVLVPNATTGINTVLRNVLPTFGCNDVVIFPSTIYPSCRKTIQSILESIPDPERRFQIHEIKFTYPVEDDFLVDLWKETIWFLRTVQQKNPRLAIFDTIVSGPGVRVPWERLASLCKETGVMNLVDGAHGIGHVDLSETGKTVKPDFMVTNCHKWLFVPRGCCALYVPFEKQKWIRTSLPTSHGYLPPPLRGRAEDVTPGDLRDESLFGDLGGLDSDPNRYQNDTAHLDGRGSGSGSGRETGNIEEETDQEVGPGSKSSQYFTTLFVDVATVDTSSYTSLPAALEFRSQICGGEEAIRAYCFQLAHEGGNRAAAILGTEVMDNSTGTLRQCNFANVRLPLTIGGPSADVPQENVRDVVVWIYRTAAKEYDTYMQTFFYGGNIWTRFSAQVYLEVQDIEWGARTLGEICGRIKRGEWRSGIGTKT